MSAVKPLVNLQRKNPFALPEGNVQIAFSGERTSAYMLYRLVEANPEMHGLIQSSLKSTKESPHATT